MEKALRLPLDLIAPDVVIEFKSLLPHLNDVQLLHVERIIQRFHREIEWEKKKDFIGDY